MLLSSPKTPTLTSTAQSTPTPPLVKICGTHTAKAAIESGADMIGLILVSNTKRTVDLPTALSVSSVVHSTSKPTSPSPPPTTSSAAAIPWLHHTPLTHLTHPTRALLVGVFHDQPLSEIIHLTHLLSLDLIQLHGTEPLEFARLLSHPVIKKFDPTDIPIMYTRGYHSCALLDSGTGGTGELLDLSKVKRAVGGFEKEGGGVMLAGGLDEKNVCRLLGEVGIGGGVLGVDVSSGVETGGRQDLRKIRRFVYTVKGRDASGL